MPAHADLPLGRRPELARIAAFLELEPPAALVLEGGGVIGVPSDRLAGFCAGWE